MILKASQRSGANQLAIHLLNTRDNEHVTVHELRGFAANDLHGAFQEIHAVSRGTKCTQFMFSVSFNPPKGILTSEADFEAAIDEAEKRLGLTGQPRAIVFHEKEGRRHAHAVWSRIDADQMRAINMAHFKNKLTSLSRELYLDHGWALPDGLRTYGGRSPLNFTLDEWQQAKRQGRDPRETKDAIRDAWVRSDSLNALKAALEERGYFLARGDQRGVVVIDTDGRVHALARQASVRTKDVTAKLGDNPVLPSVDDVKTDLARSLTGQAKGFIAAQRERHAREIARHRAPLASIVATQRAERTALADHQTRRWMNETQARAARFRVGLLGLWDTLTGRKRALRAQNEAEAIAGLTRDRNERDALSAAQLRQRAPLQDALDRLRVRHAQERRVLIREAVAHRRRLTAMPPPDLRQTNSQSHQPRRRRRGPALEL